MDHGAAERAPAAVRTCDGCGLSPVRIDDEGKCARCGHRLPQFDGTPPRYGVPFAVASLLFLAVGGFGPLIEVSALGVDRPASIWQSIVGLADVWYGAIAIIVLIACLVLPFLRAVGYLYLLARPRASSLSAPRLGSRWPGRVAHFLIKTRHWAMADIFVCGLGVSAIKILELASVGIGIALASLVLSIAMLAILDAKIGPRWPLRDVTHPPLPPLERTALSTHPAAGMVLCPVCHWETVAAHTRCDHCHARLAVRKPFGVQRMLAFTVAGTIAYIPANILPFLAVERFGRTSEDTILSGVVHLADGGMWFVAAIVFFASIVVPVAKLTGLYYLGWTVARGHQHSQAARSTLFDWLEATGRWSMIDIFILAILASVVTFQPLMLFTLGPGALAFAAMVTCTLLATETFDRRLLWDESP